MSGLLKVHELTFALVIRNYDLSLAHGKFLQSSGIVPDSWSLTRQPVANERVSQTSYSNGVIIIGEPHRCLFAETLDDQATETFAIPEVVQNYVSKLSNLTYHAVGINYRAYLQLGSEGLESYQDFYNQIVIPGAWQQHGNQPVQTELKLFYNLDRSRFTLTIDEGKLRQPESEALPIIVFSGNFAYELSNYSDEERIEKLQEIIANWQQDLATFQHIINDFPLVNQEPELLIPVGA